MSRLIPLALSPAQLSVDRSEALCCSDRYAGSWLWDAELDGGIEKHSKGETATSRAHRHEAAKMVCRACSQKIACLAAGRSDPYAEGIYGGELITNATEGHHGHRQGPGSPGVSIQGPGLRDPAGTLDPARQSATG